MMRFTTVLRYGILVLLTSAFLAFPACTPPDPGTDGLKADDWQYNPGAESEGLFGILPGLPGMATAPAPLPNMGAGKSDLGFSTGGAKDIGSFRENIKNGYLPLPTDVTYEGLFYDYFFDTGAGETQDRLFYPGYSTAISRDPISGKVDYYLTVGLNSGIQAADFARKTLNLVIVLDISGSMSSAFNAYYYDQFGRQQKLTEAEAAMTKMQVARESLVALLRHLAPDDSLGVVLFDSQAYLAKPLRRVGETDMAALEGHILEIAPRGSTNMSAGMAMASGLLAEAGGADPSRYENRIIFLTDAQPNTGDISEKGLLGMARTNAARNVYTTFVGIGVDFNTELIEYISKTRGGNYYSVQTPEQFRQRMDDEFDFMVTPLVFDLRLDLDAPGWKIEKVYGSPEANEATGEIMNVSTLFPSKRVDGETKGGVVLLKLSRTGEGGALKLRVSYEDRLGHKDGSEATVQFPAGSGDAYANTGVRKAILLARYADLLKNWMVDEREHAHLSAPWEPRVSPEWGIRPPPPLPGQWERQSLPLTVSPPYRQLFRQFQEYFQGEMNALGDKTLQQEVDVLTKLAG